MSLIEFVLIFQGALIFVLLYWVNALINKCMSQSFYDYQQSKGMAKVEKRDKMDGVDLKEESDAENLDYIM